MNKVRVVSGDVHFYTSVSAIKRGVGDNTKFNEAVRQCYDSLMNFNKRVMESGGVTACGQAGNWNGINVQIDLIGNA